jgi:CubicO group peptidase (beta-lactamase class C family)
MDMEEQIAHRIARAIQERVTPGAVVGVVRANGDRKVLSFGYFTYEMGAPAVKEDSIYDVASVTKSIPTGSLALQLIDEGRLKLTDKLIDYIPDFRNSDRDDVLIKHLLTYTLDGYGIAALYEKSAQEITDHILTRDFEKRPGEVFKYTNIPAFLLGLVVEKMTGKTLDVLAQEKFFTPLGMHRTTYSPELFPKEKIVPSEIGSWRGLMQGVVHDESASAFKREGRAVGHAGVFSTAPDILTFLEMLLNQGELKGKKYFSAHMVGQMGTNQIADIGESAGLGWELNQPRFMGSLCGPHTFGKTGFTGTLCVADVEKGVGWVLLTNRIYPERPPDSSAINALRADIGDIIFGAASL